MQFKQTPEQQKKDLKFFLMDGAAWAIMYYLGLIFLVPYMITLHANTMQIGLLNTLPIFIASFFALWSYDLIKFFKSEKQYVVFFTALQAFFWIPLAFVGYLFNDKLVIWLVIIIYCIITIMEQLPYSVYREWIGRVFNSNHIVEYTSRKQIIMNLISILPLFLAGFIFDAINKSNTIIGFTFIFCIAGLFRFGSVIFLDKMSQTENNKDLNQESKEMSKPVFKVFKTEVLKDKQFLYFLVIVSLIYLSMYIAAPYYRYYFLEVLKFSYKQYIFLEVGSILGLVLSFYYWGKACDKFGSTKVLKACALFLPLYPFLVIVFGSNVWLLFLLNIYDGVLMAGLALGVFGYFYQNIKSDLIHHMSFFMIFQSLAMLIGTLIGGYISSNPKFWFEGVERYGLLLVFSISILFRLFVLGFIGKIKDNNRSQVNLPISILLQKPIIFGLNKFLNFTKAEGKLIGSELRGEVNKKLITEEKVIKKEINTLAIKEKKLFKKITDLEKRKKVLKNLKK